MTTLLVRKPKALCELRTDRHGVIEASAGTGKTYTLQHLVVELLLSETEIRLDEILLVTFTVAATSDLKKKIREMLEVLIRHWERARARGWEVAEVVDTTPVECPPKKRSSDSMWAIDLDGVQRLRHALRNFDRAAIYTIHGFCQRILVEHAFANRRLFEQEHVSEEDVVSEAFADMLRHELRPGTDEHRWLEAYLGAGRSVGALRRALSDFTQCGGEYRPSFSDEAFRRAVAEFVDDVEAVGFEAWNDAMSGHGATLSSMTTNHGPALYEALREYRSTTTPDILTRLASGAAKKALKYFRGDSPQQSLADGGPISQPLSKLLDEVVSLDVAVVHVFGRRLERRVQKLKSEEGYFTFADMVRVVCRTLSEEEDGHLLHAIRDQFRYGLIDEFQDTDRDQWKIFSRIFVESPADDRHFLYLIGDPKQAIYGFRGGNVYTYLAACDELRDRDAEVTSLRDNYRSTPAVLDACNAIFGPEDGEPIELGDRIDYEPRGVCPGKPWLKIVEDDTHLEAGVTAFDLTTQRKKVRTDEVRAGLIEAYADEIRAITTGERSLWYPADEGGELQEVTARDIYVLCRRRADLHRMSEALRNRGVPFAFLKMPKLFETVEARDIYELLLAVDDPWDRSRRARAWMTPFFDLRLTDLEGIGDIDESQPVFERLIRWSRLSNHASFTELFAAIVEESGLIRRRLLLEQGERKLTNYLHIFEILADEGARQLQTVAELAARHKAFIDGRQAPSGEDADQQRLETDEKAVQLLTIHASKGLQRGVVFVVPSFSGVSKRSPLRFHRSTEGTGRRVEWHDRYSRMSPPHQRAYLRQARAEELRLAYVAMTRAALMAYIPFASADSVIGKKIGSDPFSQVMRRIEALREDGKAPYLAFRTVCIDVDHREPSVETMRADLESLTLETDKPPLQDVVESTHKSDQMHRRLMRRRWEVTSYSKLKSRNQVTRTEDEKGDDDEATGLLPGGMATGNFLHLVYEELDYTRVDDYEAEQWRNDEQLHQFFASRARRFGRFDDAAIERAMDVVYDSLCAPVGLGDGATLDGIRRLDPERIRREVEFLFPVPEGGDGESMRRVFRSGADIEGGFVTGIVDLLFEHRGQVYFADWKSDRAHPFDADALGAMIEERYADQACLYSLALCRMLGIESSDEYDEHFGGYFYFFVRGMTPDEPGRGIYGGKVDWDQLVGYETRLFDVVQEAKFRTGN